MVPGRLVYACPVVRHIFQVWGARVAQWWEHSPPTNVARVQIPASTPYVGWVCCWFSPLLREVFLWLFRFPLSSKTNISKFQFDQESGRRRTITLMCYLQIVIYFIILLFIYLNASDQRPLGFLKARLQIMRLKCIRFVMTFWGVIKNH